MRMWNVDPKLLCRKHLLGEHLECHMFYGTLKKGISVEGYLCKGLLEIHNLEKRHDELAKEMSRRGYKHHTPWPEEKVGIGCRYQPYEINCGKVNTEENIKTLKERCPECRKRMEQACRE